MAAKQNKQTLRSIKAALKIFPKVVKEKEKASRENEKLMRQFAPLSLKLQKLTAEKEKEFTIVREHLRKVPLSSKNPNGETIVDRHPRRMPGTSMNIEEIKHIARTHVRRNLPYPTKNKLSYKNSDKYDELIAIWTDYFNSIFTSSSPLEPNLLKALIASESSFDSDPKSNTRAFGLTQITPETLKVLQDSRGEAKDFIFIKIRQKDLKNPEIAIPLAVRWLFRKKETARQKLGREPDAEELILEYKGLLKSRSKYKMKALESFKENFDLLKK